MFCPSCKLEYRAGFTRCSDCDVPLVAALPEVPVRQEVGVHDLRSPAILSQRVSAADAVAVREALNAAGIRFNTRRSSAEIIADGSPTFEFWVDSEERAKAQSVLESALQAYYTGDSSGSSQLLWGGADRGLFDQLCSALESEGIPFSKLEPLEARLGESFGRSPLELSVREDDYDRALEILSAMGGDADRDVSTNAGETASRTDDAKRLQADDTTDLDLDDLPPEVQEIDDDDLISEAWSGDASDQADVLKLCLREVGISSRIAKTPTGLRLFVNAKDVARSKEIIREVIEAKPPE